MTNDLRRWEVIRRGYTFPDEINAAAVTVKDGALVFLDENLDMVQAYGPSDWGVVTEVES